MRRTFDYDYARKVILEHPDWPLGQIACAITRYERETRNDPEYGPVLPTAISCFKNRHMETLTAANGQPLPRLKGSVRSQPWRNVPPQYLDKAPLIYLRILTRIARGDTDVPPARITSAVNFGAKLRELKAVVDLRPSGRPYIRPARPDEIDGEGNLIALSSRFPGLTDAQWAAFGTPEMRAIASANWLTNYEPPDPASLPRGRGSDLHKTGLLSARGR